MDDVIYVKSMFNNAEAQAFYSEIIPMIRRNQLILSQHGYKFSKKQQVYVAVPGMICLLKRVKRKLNHCLSH